jgi:hypothetical protein
MFVIAFAASERGEKGSTDERCERQSGQQVHPRDGLPIRGEVNGEEGNTQGLDGKVV